MAFLVLLSTISWKVEKHYCMGRLMDMALFLEVDDCGMGMEGLELEEDAKEAKDSCCNDEVIFLEGQDTLTASFEDLEYEQQVFLTVFTHAYRSIFEVPISSFVPHEHYPPPQLTEDIKLLYQVFLI